MPGSAPSDSQVVSVRRRRGPGVVSLSSDFQHVGGGLGEGCIVLSREMFCLGDGGKQFLGLASRMYFKEAEGFIISQEELYLKPLYG